ncbi:MAG: hypothetical protein H7Z13_14220 [Ferruginibacter sp.]|nr:hypothetical protein [Ferruginibacter sp.]
MQKYCSAVIFLLCVFIASSPEMCKGQNIDGDTIFINTSVEAHITFPSVIDDARLTPIDAYKEIRFQSSGNYLLLHSEMENSKKAIIVVKEGGREHHFIIVYKKDINQYDFREYTYNYKTLKLLKKHIEENTARNKKNDNKVKEQKPVDDAQDYYVLMEKGNEAFKVKLYEEAIAFFEKAGNLKPGDDIALLKIEQARGKLSEIALQEQLKNEKKYDSLKNEARVYLVQRQYEKAREVLEQAKYIAPGDGYPIRQIENINKLVAQEAAQKKMQYQADQLNKYMMEGDKAFTSQKMEEAETAYRNVLSIRQYDKVALSRLKTIDELKKQQALNAERENTYADAINSADRLFKAADYNNAKAVYNNALRIFQKPYPAEKIKEINRILAEQVKEENRILAEQRTQENERKRLLALQKETNDKYLAIIAKAEDEMKRNNYIPAKSLYQQAAAVKPLDTISVEQLDFIEIILEQAAFDKRKVEDSARQAKELDKNYDLVLTQAKSYYLKSDLLEAKIAYEAALDLKPMREEPLKQLAIINNKLAAIQQEKEINDRFDSLLAVGDSLLVLKDFDEAIKIYKAASQIKPGSVYPASQVTYINRERKYQAQQEVIQKKRREEVKFLTAQKRGDSAVAAKNWDMAMQAFKEALRIHPDNQYALDRLKPVQHQYDLQMLANEEKLAKQKLEEERLANESKKKKKRKKG